MQLICQAAQFWQDYSKYMDMFHKYTKKAGFSPRRPSWFMVSCKLQSACNLEPWSGIVQLMSCRSLPQDWMSEWQQFQNQSMQQQNATSSEIKGAVSTGPEFGHFVGRWDDKGWRGGFLLPSEFFYFNERSNFT